MPTDVYIAISVTAAVVAVAIVVGLGALIGFRGRSAVAPQAATPNTPSASADHPAADLIARELKHCLHLADCLARDADVLSAMAARPSPPSSRELNAALAQLL